MVNYYNCIVQEDLEQMASASYPWKDLEGKTLLVTGATGMLASYIIFFLLYLHEVKKVSVFIIALCRDKEKANRLYGNIIKCPFFHLLLQDVCNPIPVECSVDYIFHLAGNASPFYIKSDPVGILKSNLLGTMNVLELARAKKTIKVLFASTREVYGKIESQSFLKENTFGSLDPMDNRSCYPESKRAAETLLKSYWIQYGVPSCSVRIAHSYGPTMILENDGRVMADLMGDLVAGRDIILKSNGEAKRAFLYVTDAVLGLFSILFKGECGVAYNLSNEEEPIAIRSLAEKLLTLQKEKKLELLFDIQDGNRLGYCAYKRVGLDTSAIRALGWKPFVELEDGINRVFRSKMLTSSR